MRRLISVWMCKSLLLVLVLASPAVMADETKSNDANARFPGKVNRFLATYCAQCHGPDESEGGIRIDAISQDLIHGPHADDWHEVLDALNLAEMPPEGEKQPSKAERDEVVEFLTSAFKEAAAARRSTGGKVIMRRLTKYEYNNTLNELLAMDEDFSKDFPPDSVSAEGFKNNGQYMLMSSLQLRQYIEAARFALAEAIYQGEQPELKKISLDEGRFITKPADYNKENPEKSKQSKGIQNSINGVLHWRDFPKQGAVLVSATLTGVEDPKQIDTLLRLQVGKIGRKWRAAVAGVESLPRVTVEGDRVHLQYIIREIAAFPHPEENLNDFMELKISLSPLRHIKGDLRVVSMTAKGPYHESWPPPSHQRIFIPSKNKANEDVYAREIITSFTSRAWRRPVTDEEVDPLVETYREERQSKPFMGAIKSTLMEVLTSPDFLYLVEAKEKPGKVERLSQDELANRLSYFLWANMPDDKLRQKANSNQLADPEKLKQEVQRLLHDERSWKFIEQFTSQWLALDKMDTIAVSPEIYPGFDEELKQHMKQETYHFFAHVLHENLSALNFIDSDFAMLNQRMRAHYTGKSGVSSSRVFEKVMLPDKGGPNELADRGGLLAHASVHMANSDGEDSHVVNRGVWLVDKILGDPPPEPPADVEFNADIQGFEKLSLKQQLAAHLNTKSCANCHVKIDPFGVPLEQYDVIGKFRTAVKKVDHEEIQRQIDEVMQRDAEAEFTQIDTDGNGAISKDEWFAHVKAQNPDQKHDEKRLLADFRWRTGIKADEQGQTSHPKFTISLDEHIKTVDSWRLRAIKGINEKLPYRYITVDTSTKLPDSTQIGNLDELKAYLLAHRTNMFAENLVRRLMTYALGRSLEFTDDETVDKLTKEFVANDYKLADLIVAIVQCEQFQTK